jgi:hypothetical protein
MGDCVCGDAEGGKVDMENVSIDIPKAIEFLLSEAYFKEFEVIDRLDQHPEGLNFYEWLFRKGIISESDKNRINDKIRMECENDIGDYEY